MYLHRDLESTIQTLTNQFPIILVTGPRQIGKTTLLKYLSDTIDDKRTYVTLDDYEDRELASNRPAEFLKKYPGPLLIDEVQYAPALFSYLKIAVDAQRSNGMYWLTGSQLFQLQDGVQESLAGRVALIEMTPFSQNERFNHFAPAPFKLDIEELRTRFSIQGSATASEMFRRIFEGGMPALVNQSVSARSTFFDSYIDTYIQKDVRSIVNVSDAFEFRRFFASVAIRTGQILNIEDIARDCSVSPSTAKTWLGILERLGIIFYLHPYSNNMLSRTIKARKMYFFDTGMACFLARFSSAKIAQESPMACALFETYVVSEIMRSYKNSAESFMPYYYRDRDGKEIDLIFEADGALFPIEIKMSAKIDPRLFRIFDVLNKTFVPRGMGAVASTTPTIEQPDAQSVVFPVSLI